MEYRTLGRTGLRVSTLTFGTMTFAGSGAFKDVGNTDLAGAKRQVDLCLDAGINFFDTADIYSAGQSEEVLGEAIAGKRDKLLIATKARFRMGEGANDAGLSRHHLMKACEASLRRLKTDHIDFYWLHEWDGQTAVEEMLSALDTLQRAGKIGSFGVSNFSGWHAMKMLGASERLGLPRPAAQQIHYSLQARDAESELIPVAIDADLPLVVWSPLGGGLLSGKYRRNQPWPEGTRLAGDWTEPPIHDVEKLYDIVDVLLEVANGLNATPAQVALAWLLGRPGVASLIVGARTEAQLKDNLAAAELKLPEDARAKLDQVSQKPLLYPYWHQAKTASDRLSEADLSLLKPFIG
ncbi:aldo/keto reductase [Consotaella salsifontis]|uniref:Predicted oxidoreductase n=1 Tax=Consotaella salsifontis TaxID=1365950 RepID=A0A1T4SKL7_9HYPH|nr:aldo/keto reductase [Consotaella salsifontis]SKA28830.1 Predicted oxidoreductase [Consotaella salsifontis]